jgi:hypothetical protein
MHDNPKRERESVSIIFYAEGCIYVTMDGTIINKTWLKTSPYSVFLNASAENDEYVPSTRQESTLSERQKRAVWGGSDG